jgi:hypothetical protein
VSLGWGRKFRSSVSWSTFAAKPEAAGQLPELTSAAAMVIDAISALFNMFFLFNQLCLAVLVPEHHRQNVCGRKISNFPYLAATFAGLQEASDALNKTRRETPEFCGGQS